MNNTNPITTSRIMDLITEAVNLHLALDVEAISRTWEGMTAHERLGFDLFLVAVRHPMATEAGSAEWRFRAVCLRHAELEMSRRDAAEAEAWADADRKEGR
jgi:hypothetical protein